MTRTAHLLAATALIATASGAAFANTIATDTTGPLTTSSSVGGIIISGTATVSSSVTAAIEVSGSTLTSNTITVQEGTTVQGGDATSGTIQIMADSTGPVAIYNSGTIAAIEGNAAAISASSANLTGAITIYNTGTISGSVNTSDTADAIYNNGGTISGTVNMAGGTDTLSITSGTITGAVDMGAGNDLVQITNGATLGGAIDGGANTDQLDILSGVVTTQGAINNFETVNVSSTSTLNLYKGTNHTIANLTVESGGTVNVSETDVVFAAGGAQNISGTLNVAAGRVVSASGISFAGGGTLGVHVADSSTAGRIDVDAGAGGSFTGGSLTIHLASDAGFIASGTEYRIVSNTNGAAAVTPSLTTSTQGLYTFQVGAGGNAGDISLTILRADTNTAATNTGNVAIANIMDSISQTTNTQLLAVQNVITQQTTTAGVNNVLDSLRPVDGTAAAMAGADVSVATGGQISTRLASLRNGTSMNTGDGMFSNHFWMQGYGKVSEQDDKDGVKGYDANTLGGSFGIDTDTMVDGMTTGLAFSYGNTNIDSKAVANSETDANSYLITGYGSKVYDTGVYLNGQVSVGYNQYESTRTVTGVGTANGDFDGMQYGLKGEVGRDYVYDMWTFTPMVGAQYTHVDIDGYTETGAGGANLVVGDISLDALDLSVGAEAALNLPMENGGTVRPYASAKYIYRAGDDTVDTNARFVGGGAAFTTRGVKADRSSLNLGTGLTVASAGGMDVTLNYDADIRDSLVGHAGALKFRWAF
ncbi:MAG: autotransporter domain-containing protein [Pseudomonadaceae bacterium]|nr:autotransporter domain-containing protein [Pseudomonadaceae bacterium]